MARLPDRDREVLEILKKIDLHTEADTTPCPDCGFNLHPSIREAIKLMEKARR